MAAITPTYITGTEGDVTVVAGLDDTYTFQAKVSAFTVVFNEDLDDVSGFGDAGASIIRGAGVLYGDFVLIGWMISNGDFSPADLGTVISSAALKLSGDNKKFTSDVVVGRFKIDDSYKKHVPFVMWGKTTGAVTTTQA